MHDIRRWMTLCETPSPELIVESAPPGDKAESFIKKHKREFKKRYGKKRGEEVLYATAWKKFGEAASIRDYLRLVES